MTTMAIRIPDGWKTDPVRSLLLCWCGFSVSIEDYKAESATYGANAKRLGVSAAEPGDGPVFRFDCLQHECDADSESAYQHGYRLGHKHGAGTSPPLFVLRSNNALSIEDHKRATKAMGDIGRAVVILSPGDDIEITERPFLKVTDELPTEPGWYYARFIGDPMNTGGKAPWGVAEVQQEDGGQLCDGDWDPLVDGEYEWGGRIEMPDEGPVLGKPVVLGQTVDAHCPDCGTAYWGDVVDNRCGDLRPGSRDCLGVLVAGPVVGPDAPELATITRAAVDHALASLARIGQAPDAFAAAVETRRCELRMVAGLKHFHLVDSYIARVADAVRQGGAISMAAALPLFKRRTAQALDRLRSGEEPEAVLARPALIKSFKVKIAGEVYEPADGSLMPVGEPTMEDVLKHMISVAVTSEIDYGRMEIQQVSTDENPLACVLEIEGDNVTDEDLEYLRAVFEDIVPGHLKAHVARWGEFIEREPPRPTVAELQERARKDIEEGPAAHPQNRVIEQETDAHWRGEDLRKFLAYGGAVIMDGYRLCTDGTGGKEPTDMPAGRPRRDGDPTRGTISSSPALPGKPRVMDLDAAQTEFVVSDYEPRVPRLATEEDLKKPGAETPQGIKAKLVAFAEVNNIDLDAHRDAFTVDRADDRPGWWTDQFPEFGMGVPLLNLEKPLTKEQIDDLTSKPYRESGAWLEANVENEKLRRFYAEVLAKHTCDDCRGSGEYVGALEVTGCHGCDGTGWAKP